VRRAPVLGLATRLEIEETVAEQLGSAREARWITEEVLGAGGSGVDAVSEPEHARLAALARRRRNGEPLQYVLGHWPFRMLDLVVDPRVLIPRPETEHLVDVALGELAALVGQASGETVVVDLGTGSGAIGLSLAAEATSPTGGVAVWCCDASAAALAVASENLEAMARRDARAAAAVTLRHGDWWRALPDSLAGRVVLVVSNPPYVSEGEWAELDPAVRCHEPREALVAGDGRDGTPGVAALEAVLGGAPSWLARPGVAVVELAPHQASAASELARAAGATAVRVERDLAGRDRVLVASWR
jgi:release factor glutamine methyltransferase